jgi:hypothetical protein
MGGGKNHKIILPIANDFNFFQQNYPRILTKFVFVVGLEELKAHKLTHPVFLKRRNIIVEKGEFVDG